MRRAKGWHAWLALGLLVVVIGGGYWLWLRPQPVDMPGCDPTKIVITGALPQPNGIPQADESGQEEYGFREVAADRAILQADLRTAITSLDLGAQEAHNPTYAQQLDALKMLLTVAMIGAEVQISDQFKQLSEAADPDSERAKDFSRLSLEWGRRANEHVVLLSDAAKAFKQNRYVRNVALKAPLHTFIDRVRAQSEAAKALQTLEQGEGVASPTDVQHFTQNVYRVTLGAVVDDTVEQRCSTHETVALYGRLRVPNSLWDIGSKLNDADLAEWYLREIVALTGDEPDNPVRKRAQDALARFFDKQGRP